MKPFNFSLLLIVVVLCDISFCANILYLSTVGSPSHNIWDKTLALALRKREHKITYVTQWEEKERDNFTTIYLEGVYESLMEGFDLENADLSLKGTIDIIYVWLIKVCKLNLESEGFQKLLKLVKSGDNYDLVIYDITAGPCLLPIVELLNYPPVVGTCPFGIPPFIATRFGIDIHSAFVPSYVPKFSQDMSFFQRISNHFVTSYELISDYFAWRSFKEELDKKFGMDTENVYEIEKNISLLLANYDPVLDYPRPLPPDVIAVGGLSTKRAKALPADLQKYLDNSKNGAIIFSFGTNVRSDKLTDEKKKMLLTAFSKLKQNVIWKYESEISGLPKNVITMKFLPQNDILVHPNVKLLINHGGALSSQEAMYHGVPIIAVPFLFDQNMISHKIVNKKIGSTINHRTMTVETIVSTINEVIYNPIYKTNAVKLSQRYHDRLESSLDRAVFWVEYVLRQGTTENLRSPARYLTFYQLNLLDIYLFFVVILVLFVSLVRFVCCKNYKSNKCKVQ